MKKEDLLSMFINGNPLVNSFHIKSNSYHLGAIRITQHQFNMVKKHFEGNWTAVVEHYGFTKHIYTYKP